MVYDFHLPSTILPQLSLLCVTQLGTGHHQKKGNIGKQNNRCPCSGALAAAMAVFLK